LTTWVLLRGLAREARHWGRFPGQLAAQVPAGDKVVALDLAGNGQRRHDATPASIEALAQDTRRRLAALHPPPYLMVAVSLGGMVAVEWAAAHPHEVAGCVLINSSLRRFSPPWQRLRPRALAELAATLLPGQGALSRENRILRLTSNFPVDSAIAAAWASYAQAAPVSRANALRQLLAAAAYRAPPRAPQVPMLLLASRRDRLVSVHCSRAVARAWDCALREHPTAGHDLPLDDPQWLIGQLLEGLPL
jgi:pimeloyl-ACP methyl ester carboxylesterase